MSQVQLPPPLMPDVPLAVRILPADPSKPMILIVDSYAAPTATAEPVLTASSVAEMSEASDIYISFPARIVALLALCAALVLAPIAYLAVRRRGDTAVK